MPKLFSPLLREPAKHAYKLLTQPAYRSLCRLTSRHGSAARYGTREVRVDGRMLVVPDVTSFLAAYQSIFVERIYDFPGAAGAAGGAGNGGDAGDAPYILDCGANIGLSTLFFK